MKKNLLSIIALVCAVLALACSIFACVTALELKYQTISVTTVQHATDPVQPVCTLLVRDWSVSDNTLNISSLYIDVQLPENVTCQEARLAVYNLDELLDRKELVLTAGEADGVWNLDGSYTDIALPDLSEDDELSLWLELTLSNGTAVQHCGAQWYPENGQLLLVAG